MWEKSFAQCLTHFKQLLNVDYHWHSRLISIIMWVKVAIFLFLSCIAYGAEINTLLNKFLLPSINCISRSLIFFIFHTSWISGHFLHIWISENIKHTPTSGSSYLGVSVCTIYYPSGIQLILFHSCGLCTNSAKYLFKRYPYKEDS